MRMPSLAVVKRLKLPRHLPGNHTAVALTIVILEAAKAAFSTQQSVKPPVSTTVRRRMFRRRKSRSVG